MSSLGAIRIFLSVVYIGLMVVSIPGNSLILWITSHHRHLQASTNLLVCNLALASILVGILRLPFIIFELLNPDISYPFTQSMCQFQALISTASIMCISITLTTICIDRYIVIVHPLKFGWKLSKKKTYIAIAMSWIISLIFFAPYTSFNILYQPNITIYCLPFWPETPYDINFTRILSNGHENFIRLELSKFFVWLLFNLLVFLVPSIIMLTLYLKTILKLWYNTSPSDLRHSDRRYLDEIHRLKQKQHAVKIVITCCVAFIILNSPYYIVTMLLDFQLLYISRVSQSILFDVLKTINYLSIAYNPIIYGYFNPSFRKHAPKWLSCVRIKQRFQILRRNQEVTFHSTLKTEQSKLGLIDISNTKSEHDTSKPCLYHLNDTIQ
ncbi:Pyroglutamylated RFamide peptide receptor [Trichoplax sp. H2]|nr:Pyroglutamylated RFamide peptide receptor [Trichoplax sp. H2]|eukprot:RDD37924.1 Pyroglutamylated RFamide peptide receptor [Trichoplax sp. H2]